jgi:hypothetical protein
LDWIEDEEDADEEVAALVAPKQRSKWTLKRDEKMKN